MDLFDSLENKKDQTLGFVDLGFSSEEQEKERVDDSINNSAEKSSKKVVSGEERLKACIGSQIKPTPT